MTHGMIVLRLWVIIHCCRESRGDVYVRRGHPEGGIVAGCGRVEGRRMGDRDHVALVCDSGVSAIGTMDDVLEVGLDVTVYLGSVESDSRDTRKDPMSSIATGDSTCT